MVASGIKVTCLVVFDGALGNGSLNKHVRGAVMVKKETKGKSSATLNALSVAERRLGKPSRVIATR
jgi:hypothetical protein